MDKFYNGIKRSVGDDFYLIKDKDIVRVKELCDCVEMLCNEIDPQFYGAFYSKEENAFCITVGISETAFKKSSVFWEVINTIDAIKFSVIHDDGKLIYQVLGEKEELPEIEIGFYIYFD